MGTLFDQKPRKLRSYDYKSLEDFIHSTEEIAKSMGKSYDQVLRSMEVLEKARTNDLYLDNGDAHDEQLAGFGRILMHLTSLFEKIEGALTSLTSDEEE